MPTARDNENISSSAHEALDDATTDGKRTHVDLEVEATTTAAEGGSTRLHGFEGEGTLAAISSTIDDNLRLFRAGAAAMVVGSGLTVAFLVYRRGLHGFGSASQVPASYFERRKRLRIRIVKVVATQIAPTKGRGVRINENQGRVAELTKEGTLDGHANDLPGADVLLHAEHITILRRLLRLPPRSLFPSANRDSVTFTLRLCGVSAEKEGVELARKELVKPLVGKYCDAELLFREQRVVTSPGGGGGVGFGIDGSGQSSWPVAVCHIHRRRGILWRDLIQSRLDPKAGFGEHLLSEGVARLREELWWATDDNPSATRTTNTSAMPATRDTSEPLPALKRLLEDRKRLAAAEKDAEGTRSGLWAALHWKDGTKNDGSGMMQTNRRTGWVARALAKVFRRR